MTSMVKEHTKFHAFMRMKERSRKAWHERHCTGNATVPAHGGPVVLRLSDILGALGTEERGDATPQTSLKFN